MIPRKSLWPLVAAVLLSAALHAMVITGAHIALPETPEPPPVLHARLAPAPEPPLPPAAAAPVTAPKPRPAKHRPPPRRTIAVAPAPSAPPPSFVIPEPPLAARETLPEPETAEAPATAPEVVAIAPSTTLAVPEQPLLHPLPRRGRITYTLFLGTEKFEIGRTVQNWEFENGTYRIGSRSETTGLAAVLRSERRTYLSEGVVTHAGLQPNAFLMSRTRRGETEVARARFDWNAGQISWGTSDERNQAALPAGSQDFLSLMYQFSLAPPKSGRITVPLTTGTKFETYELDVLPEETIDTPLGSLRTLPLRQVRKPGAETIQIWLAADYRHLPVMVRFFGRDGEPSGEQVANDIRVSDE
ncbi:MAG: DUF3108 domain-containing protein [Rhodospirillaceae bacterium]